MNPRPITPVAAALVFVCVTFICVPSLTVAALASAEDGEHCFNDQGRAELVLPYGPGGNKHLLAKAFAAAFEDHTGVTLSLRNAPGAQGAIAMGLVSQAPAGVLRLGLFDSRQVELAYRAGLAAGSAEMLPVGELTRSPDMLILRRGLGPTDLDATLVAASTASGERIMKPLQALGLDAVQIFGFGGSYELWQAMGRGELDVIASSADAAARYLAQYSGVAGAWVIFAPERDDRFPDTPTILERLAHGDRTASTPSPLEQRADGPLTDHDAQAAEMIRAGTQTTQLYVSQSSPAATVSCLREAIAALTAAEAFLQDLARLSMSPARPAPARPMEQAAPGAPKVKLLP